MLWRVLTVLFFGVALTGCGGGSGGSLIPHSTVTGSSTNPSSSRETATVTILIPAARSASGIVRRPSYISSQTKSAAISVNGGTPVVANLTAGSPNCATTASGLSCTVAVSAPVGADTFNAKLYSAVGAGGSVLSQGVASETIVAGKSNSVVLTLGGDIATISLALGNANPVQGTKVQIPLTVTVKDAAGAAIVGGDPFAVPITLADSDASGATTLSATTLLTPTDAAAVTVTYSGGALTKATFSATAGSVSAQSVSLVPQAPPSTGFNDYTTFGYDNQRDVFNPNSTAITPASITNLHLAWQADTVDYNTQSQPVLATGIAGHEGILIVGGGSGNVNAYDALTGKKLWTQSTGQEQYVCENSVTFFFGVGGTAAYDASSKSLYIVGNSNTTTGGVAQNTLFHLDAATGAILGKVNFAPSLPGWTSLDFSHTSVTLGNNGLAYVGTGATCDISSWRGRIAAVNVPSMTLAATFFPAWNGTTQPWGGAGVWGWGGVSLDFNGNVLSGIGNTDDGSTTHGAILPPFRAAPKEYSAYGDAFVKVSPDLAAVLDSNHPIPTSAYSGDSVDLDLQGTPAVFQPNGAGCDPMAALQAKSGALYLYDLARVGQGPVKQYQLAPSTYADGFLGGPSYSPATGLLYAAVTSSSNSLYPPGLIAINPGCGSPSVTWQTAFGPDSYPSGRPRSVPAASAGGVVFVGTICTADSSGGCPGTVTSSVSRSPQDAQRKPLICCAPPGSGKGAVWALDASSGALLNGGKPLIITNAPLRAPPTIDGNWIFVMDNGGDLYGLTIDPNFKAVNTINRAPDSRMLTRWQSQPIH